MESPLDKFRILVVDDEQSVRETLQRWFALQGHCVEVAADGVESLELVQASHFDVVLMDLEMPRMGGVEATQKIKVIRPDLPILAITGFSNRLSEILEAGAVKVLAKPLKMTELEAELRAVIVDSVNDPEPEAESGA